MPADVTWVQGDTQPSYTDTLKFSDGVVPPLQGATIVPRLRSLSNTGLQSLTGTTTVLNINTGQVSFTPSADDTAVAGNYLFEWFVTYAVATSLGQQTFPTQGYNWVQVKPNTVGLAPAILDLGVIKEYLGIDHGDHARDDQLIDLVESITSLLEAEVGPLIPRVYEEWHDGGSNTITLHRAPSSAFGTTPHLKLIAASEYRGPIEYPLALVATPAFGSIYSVMLHSDTGSITRRSAGGRTIAFMPGRESVHLFYETGQDVTPANVRRAALECVRTMYRWPQQTGRGSLAPGDGMEVGGMLQAEVSRVIRMWLRPTRRFPAIA